MRLIHRVPFSAGEIETYRQLVFNNLTTGLNYVFEAMEDMELELAEENLPHVELIQNARDIREQEPFPMAYYEPLRDLWADSGVQQAYGRGNEAALPEK
jgi:guanine nucleotide-binding protein subunit alpha